MKQTTGSSQGWLMALFSVLILSCAASSMAEESCPIIGQLPKVIEGFHLSPVPIDLSEADPLLAGLGSYFVNALGGCNDCHTEPSFAPGGDPFMGQPEQINSDGFLKGGRAFGPFIARNLTPCAEGKPAGLSLEEFITVMRTGTDLKDAVTGPPDTPILQVMPWVVYGKMTDCDLRAVYEYLRSIPGTADCTPAAAN